MNVQSVRYKPNHPITGEPSRGVVAIIRNPVTDEDEEFSIPADEGNLHYQAVMEWVADGNTIADAD